MVFVESAGDFGLASPPKDPKLNERGFALWASLVSRQVPRLLYHPLIVSVGLSWVGL